MLTLSNLNAEIGLSPVSACEGHVIGTRGMLVLARIPYASIGDLCYISNNSGGSIASQVVSFSEDVISLAPLSNTGGIFSGATVRNTGHGSSILVPENMLGAIMDPLGNLLNPERFRNDCSKIALEINNEAPPPLSRKEIRTPLSTGVKVIDTLCTIGYGQRIGLFSGPGTGKSTLLGMMARDSDVDVTIIALVGERGREVKEFIQGALGDAGLERSVVVVSTSNESPIRRVYAALTATALCEHFRDKGLRVLLLVDSLTRTARALRELGLALGELPVRQGYTPSVYNELPKLLERAGNNELGSITAFYTLLLSGEDEPDALGDEVKSILDGHIILSNELANRGIRPAIDPLKSVSRLFTCLSTEQEQRNRNTIIRLLNRLQRDRDILLLGGTPDAELKAALDFENELLSLLTQKIYECEPIDLSRKKLASIAERFESTLN